MEFELLRFLCPVSDKDLSGKIIELKVPAKKEAGLLFVNLSRIESRTYLCEVCITIKPSKLKQTEKPKYHLNIIAEKMSALKDVDTFPKEVVNYGSLPLDRNTILKAVILKTEPKPKAQPKAKEAEK